MWLMVTIFSLNATLHYSVILNSLTFMLNKAYHPTIQKEVDELLAKGVIVPKYMVV